MQPHACAQRFRLRILRRTRSNAGRTSARSLSGRIKSIWETPSKERGAMFSVRAFARRSLQLSLQSLRSSRLRNSTRNSTRAGPKKWDMPVSSSKALRKHKCHLCFPASQSCPAEPRQPADVEASMPSAPRSSSKS